MVELCKLNIDGYLCPNCQMRELRYKENNSDIVICEDCGFEHKSYTNKLWAHLARMKDKMEYEGGMAEVLLNYSNASFFDVNDEKLLKAAENAENSFLELEKEWTRVCDENGVSPYF